MIAALSARIYLHGPGPTIRPDVQAVYMTATVSLCSRANKGLANERGPYMTETVRDHKFTNSQDDSQSDGL
jgi:hypothetical protein